MKCEETQSALACNPRQIREREGVPELIKEKGGLTEACPRSRIWVLAEWTDGELFLYHHHRRAIVVSPPPVVPPYPYILLALLELESLDFLLIFRDTSRQLERLSYWMRADKCPVFSRRSERLPKYPQLFALRAVKSKLRSLIEINVLLPVFLSATKPQVKRSSLFCLSFP